MWSDVCGMRKLHQELMMNFRLSDPVWIDPSIFSFLRLLRIYIRRTEVHETVD